jgi:hypothetical protein
VQRDVFPDVDRRGNLGQDPLDQTSVTFRLHGLVSLVLNLTTLANQIARHKLAETDVSAYVQSAARATTFVPPKQSASPFVQNDVLFEEINEHLWPRVCVYVCVEGGIVLPYTIWTIEANTCDLTFEDYRFTS